jgi:hypothetical protein
MRNAEYGMRSENPTTDESPRHVVALSPLGKGRKGPPPFRQGRLSTEVEEIASVQVLFPDRRTLDEVIAELRGKIEKLETKEGV